MMKQSIAIIGASADRSKFGNRAVRTYLKKGWDVYPVHPKAVEIEGVKAYGSIRDVPASSLDRISLYVPPEIGLSLLPDLIKKPAREVWLNPGAESDELIAKAQAAGLNVVAACSLVAIGDDPDLAD
jgi:predicted CoA-binding protein